MKNIKHIVLSGGGFAGVIEYGIIKHLMTNKQIDMDNITSMYGTSIGSWLAVCFSLNYDIQTLDDYIIKRPWDKIVTVSHENIFDIFSNKGIFNEELIKKSFKPLFEAKNIDINITMKDFYEKTNKKLYFYSTNLNSFSIKELSYEETPNLPVYIAVTMSCAIPILFAPVQYENNIFLDGGFMNNYPLQNCVERNPDEVDNIIGIRFSHNFIEHNTDEISLKTDFITYLLALIRSILSKLSNDNKEIYKIKNEIMIPIDKEELNVKNFSALLSSIEEKQKLINIGIEYCRVFLNYNDDCQ